MMRESFVSWGTSEKTRRSRAGLRAPYVRVQGNEPHRRGVHAPLRPRGNARARREAAAIGDARRAALVPSAAPVLERRLGARQPDRRGMGGRDAASRRAGADVRLLPQRAPASPAAAG